MSKKLKKDLLIKVKRAIGDFNMIKDGDKVAVGVSGGKDSLTCLYALKELQAILPVKYELHAVVIDLGWSNKQADWSKISEFCNNNNIKLHIEKTDIAKIVFDHRQESNPCSLCSRMRNGALMNVAIREGFNIMALGHHLDDAIETLLMSMFFSGKIDCYYPSTYLDRQKITMIRPLVYVREEVTIKLSKSLELPVTNQKFCPADGHTKREYVKKLLAEQAEHDTHIPLRVFSALKSFWNDKKK